ncbi:sensor histidine kinase [Azoarcus olearius]|nr:HAMP domain-containing sensor histidine kinase [Azoarcus olearius]
MALASALPRMRVERSLARRIVVAFTLMTCVVAGLFSAGVVTAISLAEDQLVTEAMDRQLDFVIESGEGAASLRLSAGLYLYRSGAPTDPPLPEWLRGLEPGFHEVIRDDVEYETLVRDQDGLRYVLLLDQEDFESRERTTFTTVWAGFALSVAAAFAIGVTTARRVIAPVIRLAGQVQHRDQLLPLAPPLAPDYADDEVGQLARAFDNTLGQLRQALQRETLFTSDVSHELRTPLMAIASTCELLLEELPAGTRAHEQLRRLQHGCEEMRELVETFLCLARGNGRKGAGVAHAGLRTIAEEQAGRWQEEARLRGLTLRLEDRLTTDGAYPAPLLRAVMSNLLRNALHYTDQGGVRLILEDGAFSVVDSGAGIPESERLSIFQPFVRGGHSRGDGIGLGLSLVQRICQQQDWSITLAEAEGGGCHFRVGLAPPGLTEI